MAAAFDVLKTTSRPNAQSTALGRLALFAANVSFARLPLEVVEKAKLCMVDALSACMTIGRVPESQHALNLVAVERGSGSATIFGTDRRASPPGAAFVNGTSASTTARSDTHSATASHPGMIVIPAVLALAEDRGCDGRTVLEAIVSGYETMCRLGLAVVTPEFASIFRPSGMIGPTAAGLAAGRVIRLDPARLVNAASLATHTASGLNEWANAGTTELAYHSGWAASNGVVAALLAELGSVSAPTILEGKAGLLSGHGALGRADRLIEGLGEEFKILDVVHKPAPACIFVQTPCQLAEEIARTNDIEPEAVESIEIYTCRAGAEYPGCDNPGPIADLQSAKMSIQFGVASVLVQRRILDSNWHDFENDRVNRLAARARIVIDDELSAAFPGRQGVRIKVLLRGGRVIDAEQQDFRSMNRNELIARFMVSVETTLGARKAEEVINTIDRLETVEDIRDFSRLLMTAS